MEQIDAQATMTGTMDVPEHDRLDEAKLTAWFEAHVEGAWRLFDATRLAPRQSLVRIATGRDAADTAFLSSYRGALDLVSSTVTAVVDGDLPVDDRTEVRSLA